MPIVDMPLYRSQRCHFIHKEAKEITTKKYELNTAASIYYRVIERHSISKYTTTVYQLAYLQQPKSVQS